MNKFCTLLICVPIVLVASCAVGPDFEKPKADLPEAWETNASGASLSESGDATRLSEDELVSWWDVFNDPQLTSLISRAFDGNLDLAGARAKIAEARFKLGVAQSGLYPFLDVNASMAESSPKMDSAKPSYGMGASASWELDVFGGTRRNIESTLAAYEASKADSCATRVAIAAEVAQNYFQYRAYQQELVITRSNLQIQKKTYKITRQRKENGFVSQLDVVRSAAQVDSTASQIPQLENKMELVRHALELLLGLPTGALKEELEQEKDLPELERFIPAGVPANLVERRPDIISAEYALRSAVAAIGYAKADLYPKFYVTGKVSYEAPDVGNIIQNRYGSWSVGPSVSWNLFQAGKIYYNVKVQEALEESAGIAWRLAVLTALKEVEDAMLSATKERERIGYLNSVVDNSRKAYEYSSTLYSEGEIEFLDLLEAQKSMLESELNQVSCRQLFISNLISLYKALGGGWSMEDMRDEYMEDSFLKMYEDAWGDLL